jgi:hypothetical protein
MDRHGHVYLKGKKWVARKKKKAVCSMPRLQQGEGQWRSLIFHSPDQGRHADLTDDKTRSELRSRMRPVKPTGSVSIHTPIDRSVDSEANACIHRPVLAWVLDGNQRPRFIANLVWAQPDTAHAARARIPEETRHASRRHLDRSVVHACDLSHVVIHISSCCVHEHARTANRATS